MILMLAGFLVVVGIASIAWHSEEEKLSQIKKEDPPDLHFVLNKQKQGFFHERIGPWLVRLLEWIGYSRKLMEVLFCRKNLGLLGMPGWNYKNSVQGGRVFKAAAKWNISMFEGFSILQWVFFTFHDRVFNRPSNFFGKGTQEIRVGGVFQKSKKTNPWSIGYMYTPKN